MFNMLNRAMDVMFRNQQELDKSASNFDIQFCVLARMAITGLNTLSPGLLAYDDINKLFVAFDKLRKHPNFKDTFEDWYMGRPVDKYLAEVDVMLKEKEEAENASKESSTDTETAGDPTVPAVQKQDDGNDRPEDREADVSLPPVPGNV